MSAAALLLAMQLAGDPALGVDAALRSEARERSQQPDAENAKKAVSELQLDPRLGLQAHLSPLQLELAYAPRLTLIDPQGKRESTVLHTGQLGATYAFSERDQLVIGELLSYGTMLFSPFNGPSGATPADLSRIPSVTLDYVSSGSKLGVNLAPAPRVRLGVLAEYNISGGATPKARAKLPLQQGPRLTGSIGYQLTRLELLTGKIQLLRSSSDPADATNIAGANDRPVVATDLAVATLGWENRLDRQTVLTVEGGTVLGRSRLKGEGHFDGTAAPVGSVELHLGIPDRENRFDAFASAKLVPAIDPLKNELSERAECAAGVEYAPLLKVKLLTRASGSTTVQGPGGNFGTLEGQASYTPSPNLSFAASARGGSFSATVPGQGASFQWLASLTATLAETEKL